MPCDSSHMERNRHEEESKRAAELICWILDQQEGRSPAAWIRKAAADYYGSSKDLDTLTQLLCTLCKELPNEVIYNGYDGGARKLADWWDEHQAADREKARKAGEEAEKERLVKQALSKLTPEEIEALGL